MDKVNFNGLGSVDQLRLRTKVDSERAANESREKAVNNPLNPSDEVSVSERAASVQQIVDKISNIPEVRQDRVEALREQIQAGNYNPSSKDIADAILREER